MLNNNPNCTLSAAPNKTLNLFSSGASSPDSYDNATQALHAMLTVYMPVANVDRKGEFTSWANSTLRCVRAKDIARGSRVPAALPQGKRYHYSTGGGLSKGALAGIVVGAIVAVGVLAGIALGLKRKRRRTSAQKAGPSPAEDGGKSIPLPPEADDAAQISELHSVDRKPELASAELVELRGDRSKPAEAGG